MGVSVQSLHTPTHPIPEVCLALTRKDFIFSCNSTENSPEFLSLLLEQEFYYQEAEAQTEVGPRVRVLSLLDSSSCRLLPPVSSPGDLSSPQQANPHLSQSPKLLAVVEIQDPGLVP